MGKERARPEFLNFEVVSAMICFALLGRSVISYQAITCIVVPRCTVKSAKIKGGGSGQGSVLRNEMVDRGFLKKSLSGHHSSSLVDVTDPASQPGFPCILLANFRR